MKVFIDTNIPMYAAGTPHPLKEPAQRVILAVADYRLDAVTDTEVFQEILYRYFFINQREKGVRVFDHFYQLMIGRILPVDADDVQKARHLADRYPTLSPRDLIHLAVMQHHQIQEIITADTAFDIVQDIQRIDPRTFT
ncbi:MAG: type II toxin-antitoxin system VapC family toxin [Bacillota bacterium]